MFLFYNSYQEMCIKRQYLLFGAANIALKGNFETKAFAPTLTIVNSRGRCKFTDYHSSGKFEYSERAFHFKANSGKRGWDSLDTQGGTGKQRMSLYSGMIHDRRKIPVIIHEFWKFN